MTGNLRTLLACCLLFCLMLAPARAEMPSSPEERYAQELSLLNSYLQNGVTSEGLDIRGIYDTFARNGNIGEHATGFRGYVQALALIEDGDFAGARAAMESLQDSVSYAAFRAYLEDGEDLRSRSLYAIRPLNELEAYMLARECEALGQYAQAASYYDQCQMFFDAYDRLSYAASVTPAPTPTPSPTPEPTPTPGPTPVPTPAPSNILASLFWVRLDTVRASTWEIRFLSTLRDAPADAIDVSQECDGSVRAWFVGHVLYIAANGTIYAPEDSSKLFSFTYNLERIDFGGCFNTSNVTDMSFMFSRCESLTELDLSGFDTGNVTDMSRMFDGCSSLTELDVSGFDTGNVTDMSWMFYYCKSLTELDVSGFDTGNVTDMSWMFACCENLTELDVSGFDTGNVTDMSYMFYYCKSLTELDVSGFDMRNAINMFDNCPAGQNVAVPAGSERPRLGITISTIDGPSAATPGAAPAGVRIEAIEEHGPAGNAGLQPYDVITEIAGERVCNNDQVLEIIGRHSPGDFIELSVCRHFDANGELTEEYQEFTVEVRLEAFD